MTQKDLFTTHGSFGAIQLLDEAQQIRFLAWRHLMHPRTVRALLEPSRCHLAPGDTLELETGKLAEVVRVGPVLHRGTRFIDLRLVR